MPNTSVKSRFAISLIANALRGGLSFITVLVLARGLGSELYGDFAFLIGSFVAFKILLGMGTPGAFYTFMSQKPRGGMFLGAYAAWQFVQFLLSILFIGLIFPNDWIQQIWVGQDRNLVLLSFTAVFLQQQGWYSMIQIGESTRQTRRVQGINFFIALIHLLIVLVLWVTDSLSLQLLFTIIAAEYIVAVFVSYQVLKVSDLPTEPFNGKKVFREYLVFCSPLILYSLLGFAHEFADRWLLQYFGGSQQQGLYEIGYRFAAVSLLAATSLMNIFWKEFAEACKNDNQERMRVLYTKAFKFLFVFGAVISGFLIPWSEDIVLLVLGSSYEAATPVLATMLFFSIYAVAGQVNGTLMYAASRTKEYLFFGAILMVAGIPFSYFVQASHNSIIPGLELGGLGMALKRTIFILAQVNILTWWIGRGYGWKFDWSSQVVGLIGPILLGWLVHKTVIALFAPMAYSLIINAAIALVFYILLVGAFILAVPWAAGLQRDEILWHLKNPFKASNH